MFYYFILFSIFYCFIIGEMVKYGCIRKRSGRKKAFGPHCVVYNLTHNIVLSERKKVLKNHV